MAAYEPPKRQSDTGFRPTAQGGRPLQISAPPPAKDEGTKTRPRRHLSVVGVQCLACAVAVLLALLLRTAGGSAYEQLRQGFRESLWRNDLLATLARLWDGDPLEEEPPTEEEGEVVSGNTDSTTESTDSTTSSDNAEQTTTTATPSEGRLPPEGALAVPLRVNRAACPPLTAGTLTSGYGYRQAPLGSGEEFHRGVDIAAPAGTPVAAMFYGQVTAVGESDSLGRYLRLDHGDGVEVLYAHCETVLAAEGTFVRRGERVALVGNTGRSTGSHLHVQISCDGAVYNPCGILPMTRYV